MTLELIKRHFERISQQQQKSSSSHVIPMSLTTTEMLSATEIPGLMPSMTDSCQLRNQINLTGKDDRKFCWNFTQHNI